MSATRRCLALMVLVISAAASQSPAVAQDGQETGWSDKAELGYVLTEGNSKSSSLGFKNLLERRWERSLFNVDVGGIRVETTTTTRTATGTVADPTILETDFTTKTAENYYARGRFNRDITKRLFWYVGGGWERNRFSGIENRYSVAGGVGNVWIDREDLRFATDYALTFTDQEPVVEVPGADDSFVGLRFSWAYRNKLGASTEYTNTLILDDNLEETSDWRADMTNSLSVAMNERLALKASLQLLYDNEPAFDTVAIVGGPDDGLTVPFELDELDTIFTTSLVVNF